MTFISDFEQNWGRDEARAAIKAFHADLDDGYSRAEALEALRQRRNRAACFIDVPEQWAAYAAALLAAVPDIDGGAA